MVIMKKKNKKFMFTILIIVVVSILIGSALYQSRSHYGEEVSFAKGGVLSYQKSDVTAYPDFDLLYTGVKTVPIANNLQTKEYSFLVTGKSKKNNREKQTAIWSAGYGELAPQKFTFAGEKYTLELVKNRSKVIIKKQDN